eukprot:Hpha_TRINITY_DN11484_c0_g1::TRINITY_DN11484_c0_g1_i1::g.137673::m.137673
MGNQASKGPAPLVATNDAVLPLYNLLASKQLLCRRALHIINLQWNGECVARVLQRRGGGKSNFPNRLPAWHGTRLEHLRSIFEHDIKPSGSVVEGTKIEPPSDHYARGIAFSGVEDWAAAVFASPSVVYAADGFSERLTCWGERWCVLVLAYCEPDSYKAYQSTIKNRRAESQIEWRVERAECITATAAVVVRKAFIDSIGKGKPGSPSLEEANKLLSSF